MKTRTLLLNTLVFAGIAVSASAQTVVLGTFSSGTNNDGNSAANATLIRVGGQDSIAGAGVNILGFTGFTAFDLDATGFTEAQLQSATFSLDFTISAFQGSPDNLTVEYLGTFASGTHNQTNVNGGDQSSGWITDSALDLVRSGAATAGNIVTAATTLDSGSFGEQYAVFRYSLNTVLGNGDNIQWDIVDSGINSPELTVVVPEPSTYALMGGCIALASVMVRRRKA